MGYLFNAIAVGLISTVPPALALPRFGGVLMRAGRPAERARADEDDPGDNPMVAALEAFSGPAQASRPERTAASKARSPYGRRRIPNERPRARRTPRGPLQGALGWREEPARRRVRGSGPRWSGGEEAWADGASLDARVDRESRQLHESDGMESSRLAGPLVTLAPTRVMLFVDASWLYYSVFEGGKNCPIAAAYGPGWTATHHVDWSMLPSLVSDHVSAELLHLQPGLPRAVEVVRVHVYSSLRTGQPVSEAREAMFDEMRRLHYDVHLGSFDGSREKCVDIALAVDMLHYATVPGAFDVAVLVSGDSDFLPALVRTRQRGKRVAICSLRNSASSSFENAEASQLLGLVADGEARLKDFDVLWLDDHVTKLVTPLHPTLRRQRPALLCWLRDALLGHVTELGGAASEEEVSLFLSQIGLGESSALAFVRHECGSVGAFLDEHCAGQLTMRRMMGTAVVQARGATPAAIRDARRGRDAAGGSDAGADADTGAGDLGEALLAAQSLLDDDD